MQIIYAFRVLIIFALTQPAVAGDGWYTAAQVKKGHQLFNNYCAECHRPDLSGAIGPALKGPAFLGKWENKPLGNLFQFEHTKMPAVNPGSLPTGEIWAITAYILEKNGFAAGKTELTKSSASRTLKMN